MWGIPHEPPGHSMAIRVLALGQSHASATAILRNELNAGVFEGCRKRVELILRVLKMKDSAAGMHMQCQDSR